MALQSCRKDYYDVLKVSKGASDAQLKRAYRKLALQYHPVHILDAAPSCGPTASGCHDAMQLPSFLCRDPADDVLRTYVQDKVKASEREAASKKFADINHGVTLSRPCRRTPTHVLHHHITLHVFLSYHTSFKCTQRTRSCQTPRSEGSTIGMARRG